MLSGEFVLSTTRLLISRCESSVGVGWFTMMSETRVGGPSLIKKVTPTLLCPRFTTAVSTSVSRYPRFQYKTRMRSTSRPSSWWSRYSFVKKYFACLMQQNGWKMKLSQDGADGYSCE